MIKEGMGGQMKFKSFLDISKLKLACFVIVMFVPATAADGVTDKGVISKGFGLGKVFISQHTTLRKAEDTEWEEHKENKGLSSERTPDLDFLYYNGNAKTKLAIGYKFYKGEGVKQNLGEAFGWFLSAAHQENVEAQAQVVTMLYFGKEIEQDLDTAYDWLCAMETNGVNIGATTLLQDEIKAFYKEYKATETPVIQKIRSLL